MTTLKNISIESNLLSEITFNNRDKLTNKEIENLLKTEVIKNKEDIIEIIPLIEIDGFNNTVKFLEKNKEKSLIDIIKESSIYNVARKNYFLKLSAPLRDFSKIIDGIYKCPKCGSRKVITIQKQTRSADEPTTEFNTCVCGYKWRS